MKRCGGIPESSMDSYVETIEERNRFELKAGEQDLIIEKAYEEIAQVREENVQAREENVRVREELTKAQEEIAQLKTAQVEMLKLLANLKTSH